MNTQAKYIGIIVIVLLVGGFGYYAISPLFNSIHANDALPTAAVVPTTEPTSADSGASVVGTFGHPASGTVRIVTADGASYVRYENLKTINGPDIYVYLAKDMNATDFVSLGKVKATEGNVNYEIPADVNSKDYPYVLTWCKTFSVLFNSAKVQ